MSVYFSKVDISKWKVHTKFGFFFKKCFCSACGVLARSGTNAIAFGGARVVSRGQERRRSSRVLCPWHPLTLPIRVEQKAVVRCNKRSGEGKGGSVRGIVGDVVLFGLPPPPRSDQTP